jgi:P pilus assembly chaperone PapD
MFFFKSGAVSRGERRLSVRIVLAWLLLALAAPAHAGLMLYPTRIVFEKNQRAAQIE